MTPSILEHSGNLLVVTKLTAEEMEWYKDIASLSLWSPSSESILIPWLGRGRTSLAAAHVQTFISVCIMQDSFRSK